jgi:non-ribosomal peptide synthase protein (TIGR01720 family)
MSAGEQNSTIAEISEKLQSSLNLTNGPLMRVAHFSLGAEPGARLFVVIHHLVVDGVSWRILLDDWQSLYRSCAAQKEVSLPAKTTSYQRWGELQEARARELNGEIEYWARMGTTGAARTLPVDHSSGANIEGVAETLVEELSETKSRELLGPVCQALRAQPQEIVLTAVAKVLCEWTGADRIVICVEGHGREHDWTADADLTRTVGWFTSLYPVELSGRESMVQLVKQTKETLRAIAGRGLGYSMLRELSDDREVRERLKRAGQSAVLFNFLGQVDEQLDGEWRLAQEELAPGTSHRRERAWEVEVVGRVSNGKLLIGWRYSRERMTKEHMKQVSAAVMHALKELISSQDSSTVQTSVSPSDFPLARLDQSKLEKVISRIQKAEKRPS